MKKKLRSLPAIEGGHPVRKKFLDFHKADMGRVELKAVENVLCSGWLTKGPQTALFEAAFAKYVSSKYAVAVNSGTSALHLSLLSLGLKPNDEVITTPMTFISTINTILHCRLRPVFVDIDAETLNIDPEKVKEAVNKKTKAILPVHLYGQPCQMDQLLKIAKQNKLFMIEDAAHALGAEYKKKKIGCISNLTCFSFYPTKNITTAEGGMVVTNSSSLAKKASILSMHGIKKSTWKRYGRKKFQHWDSVLPGYKYHLTDLHACLGLVQLKKIKKYLIKREQIVSIYFDAFKCLPEIKIISKKSFNYGKNAYHLFVIEIVQERLKINRDQILNALLAENIGVGVHYKAIHLHPFFKSTFGYKKGDFPIAERAAERVISLPLYPTMRDKDIYDVIEAVNKVITYYKK